MAIDWNSPAVLLKTQSTLLVPTWIVKPLLTDLGQVIFNNTSHWAIGCYSLEWLLSLKFEWSVLTGQRPFRWPMVVCITKPGPCYESPNSTSAALLLHKVVGLESVLSRLRVRPPGLISDFSGIHRDAHRLQYRLANQLPGLVQL